MKVPYLSRDGGYSLVDEQHTLTTSLKKMTFEKEKKKILFYYKTHIYANIPNNLCNYLINDSRLNNNEIQHIHFRKHEMQAAHSSELQYE